jgi:hypothetical protein
MKNPFLRVPWPKLLIIGGLLLGGVGIGVSAVIVWQRLQPAHNARVVIEQPQQEKTEVPSVQPTPDVAASSTDLGDWAKNCNPYVEVGMGDPCPLPKTPPESPKGDQSRAELHMNWSNGSMPDVVSTLQHSDMYLHPADKWHDLSNKEALNSLKESKMYVLGTVKDGPYEGSKLVGWVQPSEAWCFTVCNSDIAYVLISRDEKEMRLLDLNASVNSWNDYLISAPNLKIPDLIQPPKDLRLKNGSVLHTRDQDYNVDPGCAFNACGMKGQGTSADGLPLYGENCIYVIDQIGRETVYDIISSYPSLVFDADHPNKEQYTAVTLTGCGSWEGNCADIVSNAEVGTMDDLIAVGQLKDGGTMYAPKQPEKHSLVKQQYGTWMKYGKEGTKETFEKFLEEYPMPVLFWRDPLDRWVMLHDVNTASQAECGKPVIYLYPTKTTDVSVRLGSSIKVTKSEPAYPADGWRTVAEPSGALTMPNGSAVPSLYWEGTGVSYKRPTTGFVVKDGNVDAFLRTTLAKYGLNDRESSDFRAFWLSHMTGAPYYRVSFLTDEWSKRAPLFVSPTPATRIRLFMDWEKLDAPISMEEPNIVTPVRSGFTLVEWGGLLYR